MMDKPIRRAFTAYASPDGWLHTVVHDGDGWAVAFCRPESHKWTITPRHYARPESAQRALDKMADELKRTAHTIKMKPIIVSFEPVPRI